MATIDIKFNEGRLEASKQVGTSFRELASQNAKKESGVGSSLEVQDGVRLTGEAQLHQDLLQKAMADSKRMRMGKPSSGGARQVGERR